MRDRLGALPLAPLLLAVSLAGCGGDEPDDGGATTKSTTGAPASTGGSTGTDSATSTSGAGTTSTGSSTSDTGESSAGDTSAGAEPVCGDGVIDRGEACDQGEDNWNHGACTEECALAACGDGYPYYGVEVCDDGVNDGSYDGCAPDCAALGPSCGDGVVQEGYETCESVYYGNVCNYIDCTIIECLQIPLFPASPESCPPDVQINAEVSGETPLGPFSGTFAAQSFGDEFSGRYLLVTSAFVDESLCEAGAHLLIAFDDPGAHDLGTYPVHVLVFMNGELAHAEGSVDLKGESYLKADVDGWCEGSSTLEIAVEGDGWSLAGTAEPGCCYSGPNIFVF